MARGEGGGRPKKKVDEETVIKLAERQWDTRQIAAFFNVSHDTIHRRFASQIQEARQHGKAKLIDIMWDRIINGKSDRILEHAMNRFLEPITSKVEHTGKDGAPLASTPQVIIQLPDNGRIKD